MHHAHAIAQVCELLTVGDMDGAVKRLLAYYPAATVTTARSTWTKSRLVRLFIRDGFTDRYFGEPLVYPGALRALTLLLPEQFPYHRNWKQSETHPAYWELYPTIDHVVPLARGGGDDENNVVTTSMVRNAAKSNWLVEELKWPISPAPVAEGWDGLLPWFTSSFEQSSFLKSDAIAQYWYKAAKSAA